MVFTDGSRRETGTGYGVLGYHMGRVVFRFSIPFAKEASNYDAEMYALGHAAYKIKQLVLSSPHIKHVRIFSDASSAIEKIFDGSPHPSQAASILFRSCIHDLFVARKDIKLRISWTPGHGGTAGMKKADSLAKKASKSTDTPFLSFTSRSAAISKLEKKALSRWKKHIDDHPFREKSGFFQASQSLHC
jgi:ribonuclease HI